ncbi:hypothetical protein F3J38_00035 [Pantoea sp. Acro-805]|uniref:Phage protein n=1 Tax=Candidatus Pantoea formicae TaxID=2608355 RepID=A0ABX0QRS2_9GAMM|nr:hypothetical protein [Pantoea formicae]NIE98462.1 hypothetical protein [Pantoea formicae]
MSITPRKEISLSKDYVDNTADSFVISDFSASGQEYARISFTRHLHVPKELPSEPGEPVLMDFYAEALQSVPLPLSVAVEMAALILAASAAKDAAKE